MANSSLEASYGQVIEATISELTAKGVFAQKNGLTYRLHGAKTNYQVGDKVLAFSYENQKGEASLSTSVPKVRFNRYAYATVVEIRYDLGVFLDIGLPDKDLVLSSDALPSEHNLWPKRGDHLFVKMTKDKKSRLWAELASDDIFQQIAKTLPPHSRTFHNQEKIGYVYRSKLIGSYVLTEDYYLAFIHQGEFDKEPHLGQKVTGRVIGVGEFGALNLSLKPLAYVALAEDSEMIYQNLRLEPSHYLPYHDKSDPEAIRQFFGISKAQFKRALGGLLKAGLVKQEANGIRLIKERSGEG